MMETLHVYLHGKHAGSLFSDKGKLSFAYETAYLQQNEAKPPAPGERCRGED